jgi:beta-lactam-binding protein with PASTA domain
MARIVTITAAKDRVTCRPGESARQVFVVENTSGRALYVGAQVVPEAGADLDWFSFEGKSERRLSPGEADQFVVHARPSADAGAGTSAFRLLVYDTAAPGEHYAEGPTVQVEIAPLPEAAPAAERMSPWWLIVAVTLALLLLGGGFLAYWLWGSGARIEVPDLSGQSLEQAIETIESAELTPGDMLDLATGKPAISGKVVDQDPEAGAKVEKGAPINLDVDKVPVQLPDLRGATEGDAEQRLQTAGLAVGEIRRQRTDQTPPGTVIEQNPDPGTQLTPGGRVSLTVAEPVPLVTVRDLSGETQAEAKRLLADDGLAVGQIRHEPTDKAPPGSVINQEPRPGQRMKSGRAVQLTVAALELTGVWESNDGGRCYLRQKGDLVAWYCEQAPEDPGWSNVLFGRVNGNILAGDWVDLPKGQTGRRGALRLEIAPSGNELRAVKRTAGYGGSRWKRAR